MSWRASSCQKMAEDAGSIAIIENMPGATGAIAAEYVSEDNPGAYTLQSWTTESLRTAASVLPS